MVNDYIREAEKTKGRPDLSHGVRERTSLYSKGGNLLLCHDVVREVGRSELVPFHKGFTLRFTVLTPAFERGLTNLSV